MWLGDEPPLLPEPPFEHAATAWVVLAEAPG